MNSNKSWEFISQTLLDKSNQKADKPNNARQKRVRLSFITCAPNQQPEHLRFKVN